MNESILTSIKKLIGITEDNTDFDMDIIIHINSVFVILHQLGVGPDDGFSISDSNKVWSDYIDNNKLFNTVKSYMYLKVKLLFDPPTNSSVREANNNMLDELEWRINLQHESSESEG